MSAIIPQYSQYTAGVSPAAMQPINSGCIVRSNQYSRNTAANTSNTQRLYRPQQHSHHMTVGVSLAAMQLLHPPHSKCIIDSNTASAQQPCRLQQ